MASEGDGDPYAFCHSKTVNYSNYNQFYDKEHYNWCIVPDSGYDAILFGAVGVLLACTVPRKFYAILVLIAGGLLQFMNWKFNMGQFGNGIDLWLSMEPAEIFFYVFLPPLLLDSAVRIEYFVFKKVMLQVFVFAFLVVICNTFLLAVFLLFGLRLVKDGWEWSHALLFATMVASTDAVAVTAVLKQGGGPEILSVLMEGESLFNDATSIVLFDIFLKQVLHLGEGGETWVEEGIGSVLLEMGQSIAYLAIGGVIVGLIFGKVTQLIFKFLHFQSGRTAHVEVAVTVGASYLCFYVANAQPIAVSGVIAVVVYGLYGSATLNWEMSSQAREKGTFQTFWDVISLIVNGVVFMFAGASAVNFFVRSGEDLYGEESSLHKSFASTFTWLPVIYIVIFALRFSLITLFSPLLALFGSRISLSSIVFVSLGGLRGALSLIMAQTVVNIPPPKGTNVKVLKHVQAQIALWTSGFVLMTLLINAPAIPLLLNWTGLNRVSLVKMHMCDRAYKALQDYTRRVIVLFQGNRDEMLRGVNWQKVEEYVGLVEEDEADKDNMPAVMSKQKDLSRTSWGLLDDLRQPLSMGSNDVEEGTTVEDRIRALDDQIMKTDKYADDIPFSFEISHADALFREEQPKKGTPSPSPPPSMQQDLTEQQLPPWIHQEVASVVIVSGTEEPQLAATFSRESVDDPSPVPDRPNAPTPGTSSGVPLRGHLRASSLPIMPTSANGEITAQPALSQTQSRLRQRESLPQAWERSASTRLDVVAEQSNEEVPLLSHSNLLSEERTIRLKPIEKSVSYENVRQLWAGKGRMMSLRTFNKELLMEARIRLISGMKHYFHEKKAVGLLSNNGLRTLNWVCDNAMDNPHNPIGIWESLRKDILGTYTVGIQSYVLYTLRSWISKLNRAPAFFRWIFRPPLRFFSYWIGVVLSQKMLLALEVSIEYWLALGTYKSQVPWLVHSELVAIFTEEVKKEAKAVWRFIIDREIEAPERFQAIQTYRATMATLHQQREYAGHLARCGLIEEGELEIMEEKIEEKMGKLERRGPRWRQPVASEVLRLVPFMQNVSNEVFREVLASGQLHMYSRGELIVSGGQRALEAGSVHIVISGLLKSYLTDSQARQHEFFLGKGGVLGLLPALVGASYSGMGPAYAELNGMGKGPVILTLPASIMHQIRHRASAGDADYQQMELDMFRLAALYLVEGMQHEITESATSFYMKRGRNSFGSRQQVSRMGVLEPRFSDSGAAAELSSILRSHVRQVVTDELLEDGLDGPMVEENTHQVATGIIEPDAPSFEDSAPFGTLLRDCQLKAQQVYEGILNDLTDSELMLLPAYQPLVQTSTLIILHGSLKTAPPSPEAKLSPFANQQGDLGGNEAEFQAPCVMPFLVERYSSNMEAQTFWAGFGGAIVICLPHGHVSQQRVSREQGGSLKERMQDDGVIVRRSSLNQNQRRLVSSGSFVYNDVVG